MTEYRPPRLFWLALLAACLAGTAHAADSDSASEVRANVKAGKLRPCVSESLTETDSPEPVVVFQNHCTRQANVMLCVSVKGREPAHYLLLIGSRSKVRHRLWIVAGNPWHFNYNSCDKPYCTPPRSEC